MLADTVGGCAECVWYHDVSLQRETEGKNKEVREIVGGEGGWEGGRDGGKVGGMEDVVGRRGIEWEGG